MQPYLDNLKNTLANGHPKGDRTGTGTLSHFGYEERYSLKNNVLPVITTKKIHLPSVMHELIWILQGDTNVRYLNENGVRIWNEWVKPETATYDHDGKLMSGELGPIYGYQWRRKIDTRIVSGKTPKFIEENFTFLGLMDNRNKVYQRKIDQVTNVINILKNDPDSRRIIINAWQVDDLEEMALTPCHALVQFYTRELSVEERLVILKNRKGDFSDVDGLNEDLSSHLDAMDIPTRALSSKLTQRSSDDFLGKGFNITFYATLTHALANMLNMEADELIWSGGDCHIYNNLMEQVKTQLEREPMAQPTIKFSKSGLDIRDMTYSDIEVVDYVSHPLIRGKVSV